jgi:hypothetical protein
MIDHDKKYLEEPQNEKTSAKFYLVKIFSRYFHAGPKQGFIASIIVRHTQHMMGFNF